MKRAWLWLPLLLLTGCGRIETLLASPAQSPESWLSIQPVIQWGSLIIVQPSSSAIVYLLGFVTLGIGIQMLRIRAGQQARLWWGIALLLWGIGALLAGTSYEAFSYQIKCVGREACLWTSWWEIAYLLVSVMSVNAMLVAQAYAAASGSTRRWLIRYAAINMLAYLILLIAGSLIPVRFLISFELLIIVAAPSIVIFIVLNGARYRKHKQPLDLVLLFTWGWLILTTGAYYLYLISGLTQSLWARGIWFSENDVLHIGLLLCMLYLTLALSRRLEDAPMDVAEV